ncbi:MAG: hypothetical protein QOE54_3182 [Streptosporangiaceae bacterium]|jgi:hypothetical protein|nr:hypothetical protein [Streptosporangiaceae bacterium]MDX6430816.1 hypothetical protein [Streptosporangiaceae bacterium]
MADRSKPGTGASPQPAEQPPPKVTELAAAQRLGDLLSSRKGSTPFANAFFALAVAALLFGVTVVLALLRLARGVAVFTFACSVGIAFLSLFALLAGFTGAYLYTGGLVHRKNGRLSAVRWPDVSELLLWRAGGRTRLAGRLLCYHVVTRSGRKLPIEAHVGAGRDAFGELLEQKIRQEGGQVVESGPYSGRLRP